MLLGSMRSGGSERGRWFELGLGQEALGERRQAAIGKVEFDALNSVHGEKYDGRSEGLAVTDHYREILEGREFGAAQAQAVRGKRKDHPPELFARTGQGRDDQSAGLERLARRGRGWAVVWWVFFHLKIVAGRTPHCKSPDNRGWAGLQSGVASGNSGAALNVILCGFPLPGTADDPEGRLLLLDIQSANWSVL